MLTGQFGDINLRSALLAFAMLIALVFCGFGVCTVDAGDQTVVDGYGVVAHD